VHDLAGRVLGREALWDVPADSLAEAVPFLRRARQLAPFRGETLRKDTSVLVDETYPSALRSVHVRRIVGGEVVGEIANYPRDLTTNLLSGFPATWATVGRILIWQYTGDPDRNAMVRIDAVAPGATPAIRTVTVTEVDGQAGQSAEGLTLIESLAGITRPVVPRPLTLISQPPIDPDPAQSFNVLLVGQGFDAGEFLAIARRVWTNPDPANHHSVTGRTPFEGLRDHPSRIACYADDGTGVFLRMRQTPSSMQDDALSIPPDAATLLRDYLAVLTIAPAGRLPITANTVWLEKQRQIGVTGRLIVILRNGRVPARSLQDPPVAPPPQRGAELYQLEPSENYPVPVVAVNVTWNDELSSMAIVRALAQNLGGLRDEFELPGEGFDHPATVLTRPAAPNLLFLDGPTRDRLGAAGAVPADLANQALADWRLPAGTPLDFVANGAPQGALGRVHLVEGGDGFRRLVVRSDFDCLMRRMPVTVAASVTNAAGQPVRADVPFCRVCLEWLQGVLLGARNVSVGTNARLDTQRILYDWVSWGTRGPAAGHERQ
jgi:hypothetical protein